MGYSPWGLKESDTTKRLTHIGYEKLFIQSSDSSTCHFKKSKHKNLKLKLEEWNKILYNLSEKTATCQITRNQKHEISFYMVSLS